MVSPNAQILRENSKGPIHSEQANSQTSCTNLCVPGLFAKTKTRPEVIFPLNPEIDLVTCGMYKAISWSAPGG